MLDTVWQYLLAQVNGNHFFSGAFLAGIGLAAVAYARGGGMRLYHMAVRRLMISATIHSEDELYVPLSRWLKHHRFDAYAQQYRIRTTYLRDDYSTKPAGSIGSNEPAMPAAVYGPAYGTYTFRYAGKWIRVTVSKEGDAAGQGTSAQTREFLTITYLGLSRKLLDNILDEVIAGVIAARETSLCVYQAGMHGWRSAGYLRLAGALNCPVVLDGELLEDIEGDIERFFQQRAWYEMRGIPWRRGFLLHGPPGTGKTSLCRYLARRFGLSVYIVDAAGYLCSDLGAMLKEVPARSLVLFEDIDCHAVSTRSNTGAVVTKEPGQQDPLFQMNIGTLLNVIDGISPPEQMLIFMTSNNPQTLDPALVRPGRVDRKIFLGHCSPAHATKLLAKFFPDAGGVELAAFESVVPADVYSPADLQDIFIRCASIGDVLNEMSHRYHRLEAVRA